MFIKRTALLNFTFIPIKCKISCIVISSSGNRLGAVCEHRIQLDETNKCTKCEKKYFFELTKKTRLNKLYVCIATAKYTVGHLNGWNKNVFLSIS